MFMNERTCEWDTNNGTLQGGLGRIKIFLTIYVAFDMPCFFLAQEANSTNTCLAMKNSQPYISQIPW